MSVNTENAAEQKSVELAKESENAKSVPIYKISESVTAIKIVADRNYRPYSYVENNQLQGLLIEVIKAVDEKLPAFSFELSPAKWSHGKAKVRNGEYVALLGAYFHGHDWPLIYPYSYPILSESLVTVCSDEYVNKRKMTWPTDYTGAKIGTVAGYDGWLDESIKYRKINTLNFFEFPNSALALMAVYNDIVECTLFEEASFAANSKALVDSGKITNEKKLIIVNYLSKNTVHLAYSEKVMLGEHADTAYELQKAFDAQLFLMLKSNELQPIFERYGLQYQ